MCFVTTCANLTPESHTTCCFTSTTEILGWCPIRRSFCRFPTSHSTYMFLKHRSLLALYLGDQPLVLSMSPSTNSFSNLFLYFWAIPWYTKSRAIPLCFIAEWETGSNRQTLLKLPFRSLSSIWRVKMSNPLRYPLLGNDKATLSWSILTWGFTRAQK